MTANQNDPGRMSETDNDSSEATDLHADKYNDPRAKITRRGVMIAAAVAVFGVLGSAGSIYQRKTRLEKSREFWGDETILAFQLAERIKMNALCGIEFDPVELTATPGLGHLRHVLLDERSYDWETANALAMMDKCEADEGSCIELVLTDPTAHRFETVSVIVDLNSGWVGPSSGEYSVQTTKRVQPALSKFLKTLITVQQKRYDFRD